MPRLAIAKEFLRDYARLQKPVQDRVTEVFSKFENDPHSGRNLEKITNARDDRFRSIRITRDVRGIVLAPDSGDVYTLLKVLPHDDAYDWAQRRTASVNSATGGIEIRDTAALDATLPELSRLADSAPTRLFEHVGDADLRRLGIDDQTLDFARALTDQMQLDAAQSFLPTTQWDVLSGLAAGLSPDEVWAELGEAITSGPVDTDDLDAAIERSADRVVLVDGPEELLAVFAHPFALWRVYLHPLQRTVVEAGYRGPARVTGGPGTGKTVVVLHRAHHLAARGEGSVVTTFTSTLADSLSAGIKLLTDSPDSADRIEVAHVDQLAHRLYRREHGPPRMLDGDDEKRRWKRIVKQFELPFTETFLAEEWRQVVLAQRVGSAEDYLGAKRTGRGRRLGARQKAQVWQAIWEFQRQLHDEGLLTHETVRAEATRLLERLPDDDKPYRHIVVDEAQDLSPEGWRFLRAAAPARPDDLFLAGDTHQRIYAGRVSLREVGVHVTGRSTKLRINYRTTAEILAWSLELLHGERIDDMDGGLDSIAGCRSEMHGLPPTERGFATREEELRHLTEVVTGWLDAGVEAGEIGVAARSNWLANKAQSALERAGVSAAVLSGGRAAEDVVSVGTMHRMKGLEFRCLAVIWVGEKHMPPPNAVTPAEEDAHTHEQDLQRERCLLFVACTRAREQLAVSWHGERSGLLPAPPEN
ncbi:UvrD-helicase domain-containing protein [Saccharomonospora iraqiensis]|uniref:UvrD-helicase domain-containing protein n=1 Tax=Saccharomonospora iraqiensis TaxID=52698 RepID=UPI00040F669E|nr:UvrD-helicase domain-containing protein [Saccharomonospora iraqiensis]